MTRALLFDTSNMVYRMFARAEKNELDPLESYKKEVTNVINNHKHYSPIFAIDCKRGRSWRNKLLPDYKANRTMPSPELLFYRDKMIEWTLNNFENYAHDEEEADDIIGTLTSICDKSLIVSNDGDYQQLLKDGKIEILCPNRSGFYDYMREEEFRKKYELAPMQLIDLKALKGDTSDNYKGCPGVGDKYALELIKKYNKIEEIYENIETVEGIKERIKLALINNKEYVELCKILATIKQDIPLDFNNKEESDMEDTTLESSYRESHFGIHESSGASSPISFFSEIPF